MESIVTYAFYAVVVLLVVVLAAGIINLVRTDDKAQSRSNKLMRLRVAIQFVAVLLLVVLGWLAGNFG